MNFLHHLFDRFLHTRHVTRHFARRLILDTLTLGRAPTPATSPDLLSRELQRAASDELPALIERLQSDPAGLSDAQAAAALAQHGPNEVEHEKPLPAWLHLWHSYRNPFNVLLTVLALISYLTSLLSGKSPGKLAQT